jgi:HEAT repeat protein
LFSTITTIPGVSRPRWVLYIVVWWEFGDPDALMFLRVSRILVLMMPVSNRQSSQVSWPLILRLVVLRGMLAVLCCPLGLGSIAARAETSRAEGAQSPGAEHFRQNVVNPAVENLVAAVSNQKSPKEMRLFAIQLVAGMGGDAEMAVPSLAQVLKERDGDLRLAALKALLAIGDKAKNAVPEVSSLLKDPNEGTRIVAASLLAKLGVEAKSAIPDLVDALGDRSQAVRANAIHALSSMGGEAKSAVPNLTQALEDRDPEVRTGAALALARMGSEAKSAVPTLMQILGEKDHEMQVNALRALGQMGSDAATAVNQITKLLENDDRELRSLGANALGQIGEPASSAVAALTKALKDGDKDVRLNALGALGKVGIEAQSALPTIVERLTDENLNVRLGAAGALHRIAGRIQDKAKELKRSDVTGAIEPLEKALPILDDPKNEFTDEVKSSVRRALVQLKAEKNSRLLDRSTEWAQGNPLLAGAVVYGMAGPLFWLMILWLQPLWILKLNNLLQPYTDFQLPLPMGNTIKVPLRYVMLVGFLHHHPRVLDAWVDQQAKNVADAFAHKSTVNDRRVYIPMPVVMEGTTIAELTGSALQARFSEGRQCLLVWGEGGIGKTSLACHLAKWAMSADRSERLAKHRMLPVLLEQELDFKVADGKDAFREAIRGQLQAMIDSAEPIADAFLEKLLRQRRLLVVVDRLSELSDSTRQVIRPGHPDFPANALIVTSRIEETLDNVPKTVMKPLRIEGNRLSSFLEAYLTQCQRRELFTDPEYFDACSQLSTMVGQRHVTVLLAKLYAEQMIALKTQTDQGFGRQMPDNIPDLMLSYLNELNRDHGPQDPSHRVVHQVAKVVAWECLKQTYRPGGALRSVVLAALQQHLAVDETTAIAHLAYLENRLRIVQAVGPTQDQICFALDPLAECLAALHWVEQYGGNLPQWQDWLIQADGMPGAPETIQGLLLAMRDCCMSRGAMLGIPDVILDELGQRVGLSPEVLHKTQVEQRLQRLTPLINSGDRALQIQSIRELGDLGAAAKAILPALVRQLHHGDWQVRQELVRAIGAVGAEARMAIPALMERLGDGDRRVSCEALASMGRIGVSAIPALITALESKTNYVRSTAAWVLSGFESEAESAVLPLVNCLRDEDWQVQWVVIYALGCIGPMAKPAIPGLIEACKGRYVLVAQEASRSLWRINGEEAAAIVTALGEVTRIGI